MNEDYLKVDSRTLMRELRELSMAENTLYKLYLETETKAKEITNDLQHCKALAKDNTNSLVESGKVVYNVWWRASTLWLSDKLEYKYPKIYRNCMNNRGHSVVN